MTDDPKQLAEHIRAGLIDGCAFACGCDRPGNPAACIHAERFAALNSLLASLENAEKERDEALGEAERAIEVLAESDLVAVSMERDRYQEALEMVRRIARYGVGPDTTPTQALETIAVFVERRLSPTRSSTAEEKQ